MAETEIAPMKLRVNRTAIHLSAGSGEPNRENRCLIFLKVKSFFLKLCFVQSAAARECRLKRRNAITFSTGFRDGPAEGFDFS